MKKAYMYEVCAMHSGRPAGHVKIKSTKISENPFNSDFKGSDNYKCKLTFEGRTMTTYFSKGKGHNGVEPTATEVIDCMLMDSQGIDDSRSFEEWASNYGYSEDSRHAEKIYKVCVLQAKKIKQFLGSSYASMLSESEAR